MTLPSFEGIIPNFLVDDIKVSTHFYKNILGFDVLMQVPEKGKADWVMMQREKTTIMLQTRKSLIEEYPALYEKQLGGGLILYCLISGIEHFYEQIKNQVQVIKALSKTTYKMKEFAILDCNGFVLVFAEEI